MDCSSDDSTDCAPPLVVQSAKNSSLELLPEKSCARYKICYKNFMKWRADKKIFSWYSENVLMAYVGELSGTIKPNSLLTQQ